ncbi:MAG: protein kinase [Acidobacteriota bacterium]|nr:protein kinase [Acidobacteriota bacterium]
MTLGSGTRLGPYEILAPIGAGGMGEVYRARDTRLQRTVAIKVLSSKLAASEEIRRRFEREARTISQLSHPHICAVYDVGREGDVDFLVMEHLEGETLSARLARGALPVAEVLRYAAEVADALDRAHRAGIVHRDLKPGNVMLTASGAKLLDFGLARILEPDEVDQKSVAETATGPLTERGAVLGTLAYMAPEQLEGHPADTRADVFAFGAVLYEMASGRPAFGGDSRAALMVSILSADPPPISRSAPLTPSSLESLVRICLSKSPSDRWQSMHDVSLQLRHLPEAAALSPALRPPPASRRLLPWSIAAGLAAALAALLLFRRVPAAAPPGAIRLSIPPPPGGQFVGSVESRPYAFSPDGRELAFVGAGKDTSPQIWLRSIASFDAKPLAGTEGARSPFWSPDGSSIGYFGRGKLLRVDRSRGVVVPMCEIPAGIGYAGSWGADGVIVFASVQGDAIYRLARGAEKPEPVLKADPARGVTRVTWPWFLPDGRTFLYMARHPNGDGSLMASRPGQAPVKLGPGKSDTQYVDPGLLVFVRDGTLLAQRFDAATLTLSGEAAAIAESVVYFVSTGGALFATSRDGALAYQPEGDANRLVWFDRSGRSLQTIPSAGYLNVSISPDGQRVLFDRIEPGRGNYNLWILDRERGIETRVTSSSDTSCCPVWLPDGKSLIYSAVHGASPRLYRRELGSGREEPLMAAGGFQVARDVSRDGRLLLWGERTRGAFQLRTFALTDPSHAVTSLTDTSFRYDGGRFSPSGRHVLFESDESGKREVYLAPLDAMGEKLRISSEGAGLVRWSRDGSEVFYVSTDDRLFSVPVRTEPTLSAGKPTLLFQLPPRGWNGFDVAPDGKSFLAVVPERVGGEQPVRVVLHWPAELTSTPLR